MSCFSSFTATSQYKQLIRLGNMVIARGRYEKNVMTQANKVLYSNFPLTSI